MKTLLYVPIIHTRADLGSLAKAVAKRGIDAIGAEFWEKHTATVEKFWDVLSDHFAAIDAAGMKVYQDGMPADGELGAKIVEESVKSGSRNYELVAGLLKRGAVLIKTEDFGLVKQEMDRLVALTRSKSFFQKLAAYVKYKWVKDKLLAKRDDFIAKRINETLGAGRTGILFIGAGHNIKKRLSPEIRVIEIKDAGKVKEYQELLPFYHRNKERVAELEQYLAARIT
ncbi:MAG: hypothetical protein KKH28_08215 [Elusimicrobia bacterium]|nr:hypothetical protein [Elusimicrobiota bacterium]